MKISGLVLTLCLASTPENGLAGFVPSQSAASRIHKNTLGWGNLRATIDTQAEGIKTDFDTVKDSVSIQPTERSSQASAFVNDGPFQFMRPFLDLMGVQEGKSIKNGPFVTEIDKKNRVSDEEARSLRQTAANDLQNIDKAERQRRDALGDISAVICIVYVAWATLVADNGDFAGHVLRFLSVIPLFMTVGFKKSAQSGL